MDRELTPYCINDQGVLAYVSGSSFADIANKTEEDFDREYNIGMNGIVHMCYQYEVMGVGEFGLLHGRRVAQKFGLDYVMVGRCRRGIKKEKDEL